MDLGASSCGGRSVSLSPSANSSGHKGLQGGAQAEPGRGGVEGGAFDRHHYILTTEVFIRSVRIYGSETILNRIDWYFIH